MTWDNHLYGNKDNKGLIEKLSYRAHLVNKLSKIMPKTRLKSFAEGIFFSILNYGIEAYGNVWGLNIYDDHVRNSPAFSKDDNRRLQIIVNKVLRCITGLDRETSTRELHEKSGLLSVHQRCAFFTMVLVHKTLITRKPEYHLDRLSSSMPDDMQTRRTGGLRMEYKLSISRCSFFYRGCKL